MIVFQYGLMNISRFRRDICEMIYR